MKYEDWLFGKDGALFKAASEGDLELVKELCAGGANASIASKSGYTPLHRAAQNGHADIVSFLVSRGAPKEARANDGETPLSLARTNNHEVVARILQEGK